MSVAPIRTLYVVVPTRTVGVGFSIVGLAGDTSTINYEIR